MNVKEFATLKNSFDRRKELKEFEEYLKKNPLQESEYRDLIDDTNLEPQEKIKYFNHIKSLRKNEMIIDDIPEPYGDFVARVEKEGIIPIKKSVMKQMSTDELKQIMSKKMGIYPDIKGEHITHYRYRDKKGYTQKTGEGQGVRYLDSNDVNTIKQANKIYREAKDEIQKTLSEIEINGDKYQDFMIKK